MVQASQHSHLNVLEKASGLIPPQNSSLNLNFKQPPSERGGTSIALNKLKIVAQTGAASLNPHDSSDALTSLGVSHQNSDLAFLPKEDRLKLHQLRAVAHANLKNNTPQKPERMRNKIVSKPGFGSHVLSRRSDSDAEHLQLQKELELQNRLRNTRMRLLQLHCDCTEEQAWREESKAQSFARSYKDNEVDDEKEKKLHVARTRESIPFGMNIRNAAYKAAFGKNGAHPVLQRYATMVEKSKKHKNVSLDPLDDLSDDDSESDDSVSNASSGSDAFDICARDLAIPGIEESKRAAAKDGSKMRKGSARKKAALSGPIKHPNEKLESTLSTFAPKQ